MNSHNHNLHKHPPRNRQGNGGLPVGCFINPMKQKVRFLYFYCVSINKLNVPFTQGGHTVWMKYTLYCIGQHSHAQQRAMSFVYSKGT